MAATTARPDSNPTPAPVPPTGARLLIVDDNAQLGAALVELFGRHGYTAVAVRNGRKALEHMAQQPVDLVITDIFMPDCDGLELLRELHKFTPHPRVLAMTGSVNLVMPDMLHAARLLGAECTIRKPFESGQLLQLVSGMLGEPASIKVAPPAGFPRPAA
jgi:CheY-like chemotaxis protein